MINLSKPKKGETRYLTWLDHSKQVYYIIRVKMSKIGRQWYKGICEKQILGYHDPEFAPGKDTGEYFYFCFLETEEDARRMLILGALDTREGSLFFRNDPDLEELR